MTKLDLDDRKSKKKRIVNNDSLSNQNRLDKPFEITNKLLEAELQTKRVMGNQRITNAEGINYRNSRLCTNKKIQKKIKVGSQNDTYEQEADRIAYLVMQGKSNNKVDDDRSKVLSKPVAVSSYVQRQASGETSADFNRSDLIKTPGNSLDKKTKGFFESRLGHDLSEVKIHASRQDHSAADSVNARAFTLGNNIVFNRGEYQPETSSGKHLLAHEITHTLQQNQSSHTVQRAPNPKEIKKIIIHLDTSQAFVHTGEKIYEYAVYTSLTFLQITVGRSYKRYPLTPGNYKVTHNKKRNIDSITSSPPVPAQYIPAGVKYRYIHNFRFRLKKGSGNPKWTSLPRSEYDLIVKSTATSTTKQGGTKKQTTGGQGKKGQGKGDKGKGLKSDGKSDTPTSKGGKKGGKGKATKKTSQDELNKFIKKSKYQAGLGKKDVKGRPLTEEEKKRVSKALDGLSETEQEQFLNTMQEIEKKCAGDPKCSSKSLADLLEFYKNLSEPDREALSINQMLKSSPSSDLEELPKEILLNLKLDAESTANVGKKVKGINKNLGLIQSKITDPKLRKSFEPLNPSKLSEMNTLVMLQGMLAGASERLPPIGAVAKELSVNISNIRNYILKEIAWLAGEIAATALFSALLAPVTAGGSVAAGAATAGVLLIRLNKLRKLIQKLQALVEVINSIRSVIRTFDMIKKNLKSADNILERFEQKRSKIQELQALIKHDNANPEVVRKLEDAEDELLAIVLGTKGKQGLIDKLGPVMEKFFLPKDLSEDELKQLVFDIPDGMKRLSDMLAYKKRVQFGTADQSVTLSLKGFRAGYMLAPFVGFLTGVINDKLSQILADKSILERIAGFGGRRGRRGKFKGSKTKPKSRLKKVKTNKQKRDAAAKKKAKGVKKDNKKKTAQKTGATSGSTSAAWSKLRQDVLSLVKRIKDEGGMSQANVKKELIKIIGKTEYKIFKAKISISSSNSKPALGRIKLDDRNTTPPKKSTKTKGRRAKVKRNSDINMNYFLPEVVRHKSINAAIRKTFAKWPENKSDKSDEIDKALQALKKKHGYPLHFYPNASKKEKGKVYIEAEKVGGDIVAWKIMSSLRSAKAMEILRITRPGNYWGSSNNPIKLDWKKPPITSSNDYQNIYIGPFVAGEAKVTQNELKQHKSKSVAERQKLADSIKARVKNASTKTKIDEWRKKPEIQEFKATGGPKKLPKPARSSIGVIPKWQVKPGKVLPFAPPRGRGNAAGSVFTNKVRLFGFYAASEKKDGDHVWEIQVGGPNSVENMWPLESGLNQRAGGELARATVKDPKNKTVTMKDLKKTARENVSKGKKMWIKIKSTK